jgi:hypothetical protein
MMMEGEVHVHRAVVLAASGEAIRGCPSHAGDAPHCGAAEGFCCPTTTAPGSTRNELVLRAGAIMGDPL